MSDETIAGRYELGERLGFGGMSTVQLAFDRRLERNVAVKLLAEHLADDANFVSRFRREALAAARLVHPNIVQVFDFGLDEPSDRHYIVMEHIRGQSGAQILKDHSPMPVPDAMALVDGACRGLAYAHRHGVVHRDVKPGNLMRSDEGVVKLADFGIAKATDSAAITQAGSVLGTAAYLAPEQAHGEEAGPRTDIYALGVVAYQLVTGRLPYDASSLTELALKQQSEIPPRADELNSEVSPQLAGAIERALALDPHERWESADDMRQGFAAAARGEGPLPTDAPQAIGQDDTAATRMAAVAAPPRRLAPHAPRTGEERVPPPAPPPPRRQPEPRRRRNGPRIAALALAALLVVAAVVAIATAGGDRPVETREVTGGDTPSVVDELEGLVNDNEAD
ncbi:MAG: protein kinase [Solirubrobacteraceae bacterium MAG38_C4-C5]|nr:protein kinase [Candidatus Siliceabacter maunaloa]